MKVLLLVLLQLCFMLVPSCLAQEAADPAVSSTSVVSASPLTSQEIVEIILKPKLDEWTEQIGALVSSGVTSQDLQALVKAAWLQLFGLRAQIDLINESSMLSPEEKEAALTRAKAPIKGILNLALQISTSQDDKDLSALRMIKSLCDDELLGIGDKAFAERVQATLAKAETRGCEDWDPCRPCRHASMGYEFLCDCPWCAPKCGWNSNTCPRPKNNPPPPSCNWLTNTQSSGNQPVTANWMSPDEKIRFYRWGSGPWRESGVGEVWIPQKETYSDKLFVHRSHPDQFLALRSGYAWKGDGGCNWWLVGMGNWTN